MSTNKAFTLIELLVVIAIVGILSGFIIVAMTGATSEATDAKKEGEIDVMRKALLMYNALNGGYPIESECYIGDTCTDDLAESLVPNYLPSLPDEQYYKYVSDGNTFTLSVEISRGRTYSYNNLSGVSIVITPLSCPTDWIDSGHGFCVMKYEARNVGGVATSSATGTPWVNITQTAAAAACSALGNGARLITNTEWMLLVRDIESISANWSGGAVGSGVLARGWAASIAYGDVWTNYAFASSSGPSCLYNIGAETCGSAGTHLYKRTHTLTNGQTIWDLSGNAYEWTNDVCTPGTGTGYHSGAGWIEWNNANLTDYEKGVSGPAGNYTSSNAVGRYYGCSVSGNAFVRGGYCYNSVLAGVFSLTLSYAPTTSNTFIGFRCVR